MPKREVSSDAVSKPIGVLSQATTVEARGRLVFISGMTARRPDGSIAGIGNITEQTRGHPITGYPESRGVQR